MVNKLSDKMILKCLQNRNPPIQSKLKAALWLLCIPKHSCQMSMVKEQMMCLFGKGASNEG